MVTEMIVNSTPIADIVRFSKTDIAQPYQGYDSFNMSMIGELCCFRSSNFRPKSNAAGKHSFLTKGRMRDGVLTELDRIDHRGFNVPLWDRYNGMEDPRLINWRGQTWCLFVRPSHSVDRIQMRMLSLDTGTSYVLPDPLQRQYSKNWMPWVHNDHLIFVVDVDPLRVYEFDGVHLNEIYVSSNKKFDFLVHGGSNLIEVDGRLAAIVHGREEISHGRWMYWHAFCEFKHSLDGVRLGRPFFFEGPQIEFCLCLDRTDECIRIPYSADDATISILDVKEDQIGMLL